MAIDLEVFSREYVESGDAAKAYRAAGYIPQGDRDNAKIVAYQYLRRSEVKKRVDEIRDETLSDMKGITIRRMNKLLNEDWDTLKAAQQLKVIEIASRVTRLENFADRSPVTINLSGNLTLDDILDQLLGDPAARLAAARLLAPVVEAKVAGEPGADGSSDEYTDEGEDE